jgi:phytanoyl-CoA hydroxylase
MPCTPETLATAKADFDRDGYAIIRGFLSTDDVQQIESQILHYIREELPHLPSEAAYYEDKERSETLFRLDALHTHAAYFAQLAEQERFTSLSERLLDDAVVTKGAQMFGKAPKIGNETPAHQDGYYFNLDPNEALTIWLPLDRTDEDNGCIRYIPGSHRRGLLPHGRGKVFGFSLGLLDYSDDDRAAEVAIRAEPGDLIVHHCQIVHRADPNRSDRRRWALGLVYFAGRARIDRAARDARNRAVKADWNAANKM